MRGDTRVRVRKHKREEEYGEEYIPYILWDYHGEARREHHALGNRRNLKIFWLQLRRRNGLGQGTTEEPEEERAREVGWGGLRESEREWGSLRMSVRLWETVREELRLVREGVTVCEERSYCLWGKEWGTVRKGVGGFEGEVKVCEVSCGVQ